MIWKRIITYVIAIILSFFLGIMVSQRINWRVFVLHDSERVTIKVK